MKKYLIGMVLAVLLTSIPLAWGAPANEPSPNVKADGMMYGKFSPQPLSVKLSAHEVPVGGSIWMTVSGGVEPYILITVENKIEVTPRGKNTYQITGLTPGDSGLTIGDSKNNTITKVISVLPRR